VRNVSSFERRLASNLRESILTEVFNGFSLITSKTHYDRPRRRYLPSFLSQYS
jgi:hypothetical protein